MELKNFAGKKKPKKIEKRAKKLRVEARSPPRRVARPVHPPEQRSACDHNSDKLSHHFHQQIPQIMVSGIDLAGYAQSSPSEFEDQPNPISSHPEPSENLIISFHKMHDAQSQDRPVSQFHENRFVMASELNEDEGIEAVFQQEFRRVSRLDSPKMSISSSIKGRSVFGFQFQEDLPPLVEPSDMFTKMQNLCNPPPKANSRFRLMAPLPVDQGSANLGLMTDDADKSLYSQMLDERNKKSSSRRSRRASRKNSSVENLNV